MIDLERATRLGDRSADLQITLDVRFSCGVQPERAWVLAFPYRPYCSPLPTTPELPSPRTPVPNPPCPDTPDPTSGVPGRTEDAHVAGAVLQEGTAVDADASSLEVAIDRAQRRTAGKISDCAAIRRRCDRIDGSIRAQCLFARIDATTAARSVAVVDAIRPSFARPLARTQRPRSCVDTASLAA